MNKHHFIRDISIPFASRALLAAGFLAALATGARTAQAQAFANFTGGNDTTAGGTATPGPDTYKGTAGSGWAGGYVINGQTNNGGLLTATVASASPLSGGGNYLAVTDGVGDLNDATLTRQYSGVSATSSQIISFDYRLDTALSGGQYVTLGDPQAGAAGFSANSSFIIRDYATTTGGATAGRWALYNGIRGNTGFNTANFVDSGLAVTPGDTYHFTINLNPTARTYSVTIADTTTSNSVTGGTENFRTDNTFVTNTLGFNNSFGATAGASSIGYSVDNIAIVPEPSTWAFVTVCAGILGVISLRRRIA